ncbi:hypothetical protein ATANTOWER_012580 [Ataeniobius toweri]|uniref:Secreted protein n=1 Tax=Ataeniobius toweri TaxID=208326 RepID=A0ABU7AFT8_9TELE|nr:hypothetical protein [Ataeniobius toweri]
MRNPADDVFIFITMILLRSCWPALLIIRLLQIVTFTVTVHSSRSVISASALTRNYLPTVVQVHRLPLSVKAEFEFVLCKQMLYFCCPDEPSEVWTTSCFTYNSPAIALKGEGYTK